MDMQEIWKKTGMSIQRALEAGAFGGKPYVSAFDPKRRIEYAEIAQKVKREWEAK